MRVSNDDNFNLHDGLILVVLVIIAILFAAAVYREKHNESIILEATKQTSQIQIEDVGWI